MKKKILIIGYGSIGKRHADIINNYFNNYKLYILSSRKTKKFENIRSLKYIKTINPDFIIIASETYKHYQQLLYIEKNLENKKILVEKPLFNKNINLKIKNNKVFVAYNLRFHPLLKYLKELIKNKHIWSVNINCSSYLPNWRLNRNYEKTYSASKAKGGGVILDLSHEIDYLLWLFGDVKKFTKNYNKISNLKITSEDYLTIIGKTIKKIYFNLSLNYYSLLNKREIVVDGKNISIFLDLINNFCKIKKGNKLITKKIKLKNLDLTYKEQMNSFLNGKKSNICTYNEALKVMNLINLIKL
tara:strand:- start:574 stop:1476 length:903 start_codon:yes stop_codon:yes gene_type:complete